MRNELDNEIVNKQIEPKMEIYARLMKKIASQDTASIVEYRIELINELIDLELKRRK